ncbi:MAG: Gfo/Idh/MocA family protein [Acidimicrobiia bacterium]
MTVRYGIVGGGFVAGFHVRSLEAVRGVEVAGLTSRTPPVELADEVRRLGLGDGVIYDTIEDLASNVDVVCLFAPNFARLDAVRAVARAVSDGATLQALVCEKPLARNMAEAREMMQLADQMGVKTAFFENQLHLPVVQAARDQLADVAEAMGPPMVARASEEHSGPHNAWFWDPVLQGGGVMSDMGCHSLALGRYLLTPTNRPPDHLLPEFATAEVASLKWTQPRWRDELIELHGVDYHATPAEDYATGMVTYLDPETGLRSKAQFTVSWMYDKQGLRLLADGLGAGYAFEINSLRSPLELFIGDAAARGVSDAEMALEKSTASQGLLTVQPDEPGLYGYVAENRDLVAAIVDGTEPLLDWEYGLSVVQLTMACYLSAETGRRIDLRDQEVLERLETYVPLIAQGRGAEVLLPS